MKKTQFVILGLLFLITAGFFVNGLYTVFTKSWGKTQGEIIFSRWELARNNNPQTSKNPWKVRIVQEYMYSVQDRTYTGTLYREGSFSDTQDQSVFEKKYATGTAITVYYNKDAPAESYEKIGVGQYMVFMGSLSVVFLIFTIIAYRRQNKVV